MDDTEDGNIDDDNAADSGSTDTESEPVYAPEEFTKNPDNKRLLINRNSHSGGFRRVTSYTEWIDMKKG